MSTDLPVRCLLGLQVWTFRSVPVKPGLRRGTIYQTFTFLLISIKYALVTWLAASSSVELMYICWHSLGTRCSGPPASCCGWAHLPLCLWLFGFPVELMEIKVQFVWSDENVFLGMEWRSPRALPAVIKQLLALYSTAKGACGNLAHAC